MNFHSVYIEDLLPRCFTVYVQWRVMIYSNCTELYLEDCLDKLGLRGLDNAGGDDGGLVTEGGAGDGGQRLDVVTDCDLAQGTRTVISLLRNINSINGVNNRSRGGHLTDHQGSLGGDKLGLDCGEEGLVAGPGVGVAQAGGQDVQGRPVGEEGGREGGVDTQGGGAEILDCRHALQHYQGNTHALRRVLTLNCNKKPEPHG